MLNVTARLMMKSLVQRNPEQILEKLQKEFGQFGGSGEQRFLEQWAQIQRLEARKLAVHKRRSIHCR